MPTSSALSVDRTPEGTIVIRLAGAWDLRQGLPPVTTVEQALAAGPSPRAVTFDATKLEAWDSGVLTFLTHVLALCGERRVPADRAGLPAGIRNLLAVPSTAP